MGIDGGGRDRGTEKLTGKEPMDEMKDGKMVSHAELNNTCRGDLNLRHLSEDSVPGT